MTEPSRFVDRLMERQELRALLARGEPRMALLFGRRRVGKTYLLTHTWPESQTFYFTAANTTPEQNRQQLLRELGIWTGDTIRSEDYPTWRTVFRLLLELRAPSPLVLVLDEFQYLGEDQRGLATVASELNAVWEQPRPPRPLLLVLSGSSVGTLKGLMGGAAPLYGRFHWIHELKPFDYWDASAMTPFRSLRDRALAYGLYGGTPRYLATLTPGIPLHRQAARALLSPRGEVRTLIETIVAQEEGLRETPVYAAILRAIGDGLTELNEIAQRTGVDPTTALREKLERLIALGFVQAQRNLGAKRTTPFRYRLADSALMFYHTFVAPNETMLIRTDPDRVWRTYIAPRLDSYMGHIFERIVEQAYIRLQRRRRLPIVRQWGRWEGRDREGQPSEMDIAAEVDTDTILTGGIKWNRRPLGADVFHHHTRMIERLAASGVEWAHRASAPEARLLFVAANGFSPAFAQAAAADPRHTALWTLRDLYAARD